MVLDAHGKFSAAGSFHKVQVLSYISLCASRYVAFLSRGRQLPHKFTVHATDSLFNVGIARHTQA